MLRWALMLLALQAVHVHPRNCVDGKNNVIKGHDNTGGRGKILLRNLEIGTYDKNKKPVCSNGKPQITFPGYLTVLRGTVEVVEPIKEGTMPVELLLDLEKNSWLVGVVCENGESRNQFVSSELCTHNLCKISSVCGLLEVKTEAPLDISPVVGMDYIDTGAMPHPQLAGEWQLSVKLAHGGEVIGGLQIGNEREWLVIESAEDAEGGAADKVTVAEEEIKVDDHEEL